jgi:hypothetical protein
MGVGSFLCFPDTGGKEQKKSKAEYLIGAALDIRISILAGPWKELQ